MKRNIGVLAFVGVVVVVSQWRWLEAQAVTEVPEVVSPTYVAIPGASAGGDYDGPVAAIRVGLGTVGTNAEQLELGGRALGATAV